MSFDIGTGIPTWMSRRDPRSGGDGIFTPGDAGLLLVNYPTDQRVLFRRRGEWRSPGSFVRRERCTATDVVVWTGNKLHLFQMRCDLEARTGRDDEILTSLKEAIAKPWYLCTKEELRTAQAAASQHERELITYQRSTDSQEGFVILLMWRKLAEACPSMHAPGYSVAYCECDVVHDPALYKVGVMDWQEDAGQSVREQINLHFNWQWVGHVCKFCGTEVRRVHALLHNGLPPYLSIANVPSAKVPGMSELLRVNFRSGSEGKEKGTALYRVKAMIEDNGSRGCSATFRGEAGKVFTYDTPDDSFLKHETTEEYASIRASGEQHSSTVVVFVRVEQVDIEVVKVDGRTNEWIAVERCDAKSVRDVAPYAA